ncbi:glycosyltransferase family 4 protein [Chloroflexota bacterium]
MRVLLVSAYYRPHIGGIEVVAENLAQGLVKLEHEAHIVTCKFPGTPKYEELDGVKIHRIASPRWGRRYWFTLLCIPRVWRLAGSCDIIHPVCNNGTFPGWLVATLRRKRKVVTVHELQGSMWRMMGMSYLSAKLHQFFEWLIFILPFDKHICVSRYARNCLRLYGIKDEKLKVIYNGVDNSLLHPDRAKIPEIRKRLKLKEEFVYMYYGRPGVTKGVDYLIRAVPLISQNIPRSKLMIILAEDPKAKYEATIELTKQLKIEDKIILLKPVPRNELPNYIAAADCVVIPSLAEGFGFTTAEACAMGKPVVATDVGSLPEVVSGKHVLVEPRNPEAIAKGVVRIYNGEVEDTDKKVFSWDKCIREYLQVYNEVLGEG